MYVGATSDNYLDFCGRYTMTGDTISQKLRYRRDKKLFKHHENDNENKIEWCPNLKSPSYNDATIHSDFVLSKKTLIITQYLLASNT